MNDQCVSCGVRTRHMNKVMVRHTMAVRGRAPAFASAGICDTCIARVVAFTTAIVPICDACEVWRTDGTLAGGEGTISITRYIAPNGMASAMGVKSPSVKREGTYGLIHRWEHVCRVCRLRVIELVRAMWD